VYADSPQEYNTSNWRCVMPADAINRQGKHEAYLINTNQLTRNQEEVKELLHRADIIVIERNLFGDTLTMLQYWKVRNKIVASNFDDAYDRMHPTNRAYNFWETGEVTITTPDGKESKDHVLPKPLSQFKWGLRMVAGIMMPSKVLVDDWKDYSKTYYMPNYVDLKTYRGVEKPEKENKDEIIIGWGGSLSHVQSFKDSGVLKALKKICVDFPNVKVMIAGDKRVFDEIDLPEDKKVFQNFVPHSEWAKLVSNFDIGLAPLCGEYDQRRSWIKPLEYMLLKIPWIASDNKSYDELKPYGKVIENRYDVWRKEIAETITNLEEHRKFAKGEPYKFAIKQDVDKNVDKIIATFQEIIKKGYPE